MKCRRGCRQLEPALLLASPQNVDVSTVDDRYIYLYIVWCHVDGTLEALLLLACDPSTGVSTLGDSCRHLIDQMLGGLPDILPIDKDCGPAGLFLKDQAIEGHSRDQLQALFLR